MDCSTDGTRINMGLKYNAISVGNAHPTRFFGKNIFFTKCDIYHIHGCKNMVM